MLIRGMQGLGDQFHQRPFIRAAAARAPVYLATPWPSLYADLAGVRCVRPRSTLRTQAKNEARPFHWHAAPGGVRQVRIGYGSADLATGSIFAALERQLPLAGQPFVYDGPPVGASPIAAAKPIAVVRPVTVRREWASGARNCLPEYVARAAQMLQDAGYHVVSIADVQEREEWLVGEAPPADQRLHRGELVVEQLLALLAHAAIAVGPVGFILPISLAYRTPCIVIGGGRGLHNAPEKVTDSRQNRSRLRWLLPDAYCMCDRAEHSCDKRISDFDARFRKAVWELERDAEQCASPIEGILSAAA